MVWATNQGEGAGRGVKSAPARPSCLPGALTTASVAARRRSPWHRSAPAASSPSWTPPRARTTPAATSGRPSETPPLSWLLDGGPPPQPLAQRRGTGGGGRRTGRQPGDRRPTPAGCGDGGAKGGLSELPEGCSGEQAADGCRHGTSGQRRASGSEARHVTSVAARRAPMRMRRRARRSTITGRRGAC